MRISGAFRVALLATAAMSALSLPSVTEGNMLGITNKPNMALVDATTINSAQKTTRVLSANPHESEEDEKPPHKSKGSKSKKETEAVSNDSDTESSSSEKKKKKVPSSTKPSKKSKEKSKAPEKPADESEEEIAEELAEEILEDNEEEFDDEFLEEDKKDKADEKAYEKEKGKAEEKEKEKEKAEKKKVKSKKLASSEENDKSSNSTATNSVKEKKIKGDANDGIIDGSSEGSSEIDKINPDNDAGWVSVYNDPPLLVIKASLYAFISYNNSEVCDTFNMTMNAVEQLEEDDGHFAYHVVAYTNCTKNNEDETQGRFILNFIPEGKRLLLTECGHREEGEIVNWLRIEDEVPLCMTPKQRKKFLTQPMKHIHINGTETEATQTDFLSRLEEFDTEEVAILGSATIVFIVAIVLLVLFIIRKRKVQKDLERTIAGAKAEHAVEDDDLQTEADEKVTKERKGLMDSVKAKSDDPDMEEGSFVNSPAVRV